MRDINERLLSIFQRCEVSGPADKERIEDAQRELGLLFPRSYLRFLETYGAALGTGAEIAGLAPAIDPDECPLWSDVVASTMIYRPDSLPVDSIAIAHDGFDHGYFLLCSKTDPDYEGPVVEWGPSHINGVEYAPSFLAFCESWFRCEHGG